MAISLYTAGMNPNDRDLQRKTNRKHGRHAGERLAGNLRMCTKTCRRPPYKPCDICDRSLSDDIVFWGFFKYRNNVYLIIPSNPEKRLSKNVTEI